MTPERSPGSSEHSPDLTKRSRSGTRTPSPPLVLRGFTPPGSPYPPPSLIRIRQPRGPPPSPPPLSLRHQNDSSGDIWSWLEMIVMYLIIGLGVYYMLNQLK